MLKEIQIKLFNRNLAPQFPNFACVCVCCMYVGERGHVSAIFSSQLHFISVHLVQTFFKYSEEHKSGFVKSSCG